MILQAWIVLAVFIIQVIYTMIMSFVSKPFRDFAYGNSALLGTYHFISIIVLGILALFGVQCATNDRATLGCNIYSWVLTSIITITAIISITMISIWAVQIRKDEKGLKA